MATNNNKTGTPTTAIPTHLKHKPVYVIDDYAAVDGCYKRDTDVVGLSLGRAQWCGDDEFVPSVKVWRHGAKKWSRQSEETTLTRALDMAMMVVAVLDKHINGNAFRPVDSIYGSFEITDINSALQNDLVQYLTDEKNRKDIDTHIDILYDVITAYKNQK